MSRPPITRRTAAVSLLAVTVLTALALVVVSQPRAADGPAAACTGRKITSWSAEPAVTGEFARYGDDNTRVDDWTGGDGTHSVRLPDGRTLWLFSDTYLDRVHPAPNPRGEPYGWRTSDTGATPYLRHNSAVVMSRSGRLERTLPGSGPGAAGPFFPDPPGGGWRWPVRASVQPRSPGSAEKVVRVLLWNRAPGTGPWAFGVPRATEVATLSLPGLRLESVTEAVDASGTADPARRVLYGAASATADGWTYVFGGDEHPRAAASSAYLARVPADRLAQRADWRFWDGDHWRRRAARAAPVLAAGGGRGVGSAFTVVRDGPAWVLITTATGGAGAGGMNAFASYWACSPQGPWHGPSGRITPPRPPGSDPGHITAYNPQAHPEFTASGRLLLSYDVNWIGPPGTAPDAQLNGNVALYRPRFLRVRLGPAG